MTLHNFSRNAQAHPGAGVGVARVQPFEHVKNALVVLGGNANAVILHAKAIGARLVVAAQAQPRRAGAIEFQSVFEQVAKHLRQTPPGV